MHITWSLVYIFVTISSQSLQRQNHFLWWFEPFSFLTYFATSLKKLYIVDLKICLNFIFKLILNPISFLVFKSPLHLIFLVHLPFNFILSLSLSHPYPHVTRPYPSVPPPPSSLLSSFFSLFSFFLKFFSFHFFGSPATIFLFHFFFFSLQPFPNIAKHCHPTPCEPHPFSSLHFFAPLFLPFFSIFFYIFICIASSAVSVATTSGITSAPFHPPFYPIFFYIFIYLFIYQKAINPHHRQ